MKKELKLFSIILVFLLTGCNPTDVSPSDTSNSPTISSGLNLSDSSDLTQSSLLSSDSSQSLPDSSQVVSSQHDGVTIEGVVDKNLGYLDVFNPMTGVSGKDKQGNDITNQIVISGLDQIGINQYNQVTSIGTFILRYFLEHDGTQAQQYMTLTITYDDDNIIKNGTFIDNDLFWHLDLGVASYQNNQVEITPSQSQEINFYQENIELRANGTYTASFFAKAEAAFNLEVDLTSRGATIIPGLNHQYLMDTNNTKYSFSFQVENRDFNDIKLSFMATQVTAKLTLANISIDFENLSPDKTAPVFFGLVNKNIIFGNEFDPYIGVSAFDETDGDVTTSISLQLPSGVSEKNKKLSFATMGTYTIIYKAFDSANNIATAPRIIEVGDSLPSNVNLIVNGDFSDDFNYVYTDNNEGSSATFTVEDGKAVVAIKTLPSATTSPFPRIIFGKVPNSTFVNGLTFEQNAEYELTFEMSSLVARDMSIQIGELFTTAPWIDQFKEETTISVTTTMQKFTITFKMNKLTNDNGMISFCFGRNNLSNVVATTFYLDNVSLIKK